MKRRLSFLAAAFAVIGTPALAHIDPGHATHLHASDGWGLAVVAALAALAIWLDDRFRR
jgi:hypothetical protein